MLCSQDDDEIEAEFPKMVAYWKHLAGDLDRGLPEDLRYWETLKDKFNELTVEELHNRQTAFGQPDKLVSLFLEVAAAGVDELLVEPFYGPQGFDDAARNLRLFRETVMPYVDDRLGGPKYTWDGQQHRAGRAGNQPAQRRCRDERGEHPFPDRRSTSGGRSPTSSSSTSTAAPHWRRRSRRTRRPKACSPASIASPRAATSACRSFSGASPTSSTARRSPRTRCSPAAGRRRRSSRPKASATCCRCVAAMKTGNQYEYDVPQPAPLIERRRVYELPERVDFRGEVVSTPDEDAVRSSPTRPAPTASRPSACRCCGRSRTRPTSSARQSCCARRCRACTSRSPAR